MITDFQSAGTSNSVTWTVKKTRQYTLQDAPDFTSGWSDVASLIPTSEPDVTADNHGVTNSVLFYRVKASIPLGP